MPFCVYLLLSLLMIQTNCVCLCASVWHVCFWMWASVTCVKWQLPQPVCTALVISRCSPSSRFPLSFTRVFLPSHSVRCSTSTQGRLLDVHAVVLCSSLAFKNNALIIKVFALRFWKSLLVLWKKKNLHRATGGTSFISMKVAQWCVKPKMMTKNQLPASKMTHSYCLHRPVYLKGGLNHSILCLF